MNMLIHLLSILLFSSYNRVDSSVYFLKEDAVVWSVNQRIQGKVKGRGTETVKLHVNGSVREISVEDGVFEVELQLRDMENLIIVTDNADGKIKASDTLRLTLGYEPVPLLKPVVTLDGVQIKLSADVMENPLAEKLQGIWKADPNNPEPVDLKNHSGLAASLNLPTVDGDYWFELQNTSLYGKRTFRTLLRKTGENIVVFGPENNKHPWINTAVLYQLSPYNFSNERSLKAIIEKIPEIAELGINVLYLQPVFISSRRGQGYDTVDYFRLNPDYGNEEDLRELIETAKGEGMKVLFDIVLNHSSIHHPYAKDRINHGNRSHYHDFYQTTYDGAKYSSHYNSDEHGFVNYFWKELVNLNYDNEEVQRWMLEASKFWVEHFGIDGYRFDAIWGVMARKPDFSKRLRDELKSIRPDILLLAEAKGNEPDVYEGGFDAAYDWTGDTLWVSQWSWEYEYGEKESKTAFNHPDVEKRAQLLKASLFSKVEFADRILRFTENNDLPRFPAHHSWEQAKMAAALVFSLPGLPMLYQGQEIGALFHPYQPTPIYDATRSIQSQDSLDRFGYFRQLISKRKSISALQKGYFQPLGRDMDSDCVAFWRMGEEQTILVVLNPTDKPSVFSSKKLFQLDDSETEEFGVYDLLKDEKVSLTFKNGDPIIHMEPYGIKWLVPVLKDHLY